jgi:hypothetical protein
MEPSGRPEPDPVAPSGLPDVLKRKTRRKAGLF